MFEKKLQDLVKGIRATKTDPSVYISQCIQSIKTELKSTDQYVKAEAIRKLTYLHMIGYDMSWAAFHVVEVMSYDRFAHKRAGYLAAVQSFTQSTDVVLLCTNLFKKEFGSMNEYEVGLAINCLANIATEDLARDLLGDIVSLMNSAKPYVRKKATLLLYKLFIRYPQGLRLTFDRLKDRMDESDISVVSCAVNVICELANKKPKNYLGLAPNFFRLLTTSSNNWMLIKVVKLMAALVPEEPRLARKLLDPLATIIQHTPAKSLLYECISTVTTALMYTRKQDGGQPRNVPAVVRLCNDHLRRYIEDPDQNLRYLGLVGLSNLMKSHPYVVTEHQEIILECLGVDDITIRMRALELVSGMITPDTCTSIVRELMRHTLSADGHYRDELIHKILDMCSRDKYNNVEDFEWYIQILVDLSHVQGARHGERIASQLIDIAVRVQTVRETTVKNMVKLLLDTTAMESQENETMAQVLYAAAWIAGEYAYYIEETDASEEDDDDMEEDEPGYFEVVDAMLEPRTSDLPPRVQAVYIQAIVKILAAAVRTYSGNEDGSAEDYEEIAVIIVERLPAFMQSEHIEIQERACSVYQLLLMMGLGLGGLNAQDRSAIVFNQQPEQMKKLTDQLAEFFKEEFAPVNPKAQRKVPVPEMIDLDLPFNEESSRFLEQGPSDKGKRSGQIYFTPYHHEEYSSSHRYSVDDDDYLKSYHDDPIEEDEDETDEPEPIVDTRERMKHDPFYLSTTPSSKSTKDEAVEEKSSKKKTLRKKKKKKSSRHAVLRDDLMPEGVKSSSDEDDRAARQQRKSSKTELEDIDITIPLSENERIPDQHLYHRTTDESKEKSKNPKKKKKKSKEKKASIDTSSPIKKKKKKQKKKKDHEPLLLI